MLVQLPRGPSSPPRTSAEGDCTAFEAALRRDLASAPVVSYDPVLGGWAKRAVDVGVTLFLAPLWLPALGLAALAAKLRHPAAVFRADERVGYGGRAFRCYSLRIAPPTATIEHLRQPGDDAPAPTKDWRIIASRAQDRRAKWLHALELLPRFINVLRGDMSLVGPSPLAVEELEPLKTAKRYYLSARPGIVGISSIADADEEDPGHYKLYALSWSLTADALILWDALRGLRDRGELWKPRFSRKRATQKSEAPARRRSSAAG